MDAKSKSELQFSRGILVTMNAAQLAAIKAAIPAGISSSQWCLAELLKAAKPRPVSPDQLTLFGEASHG